MQNEILEKDPKADLKVYAVWFNMIWFDSRSRWHGGELSDPRVVHFWDEDKSVGRWYGSHPQYGNDGDSVWWDTYLLYGPESRWEESPSHLINMGATILETGDELKVGLRPLLHPAPRPE